MQLTHALFALPALVTVASNPLAFGPKEGAKLEKRFGSRMQLEKRSMTITIDGNELPAELTKDAVLDMDFERKTTVADEYRKMDGGRVLLLTRHYDALSDVRSLTVQV